MRSKTCLLIALTAGILVAGGALPALSAGTQAGAAPGRYTMTPTENGFLRLDTQTGAVSLCMRKDGRWACESVADDAKLLRDEIARLARENEALRRRLAELEGRKSGRPGLTLPSEEEVDKALSLMERFLRKFKDMAKRLAEDPQPGTPL